MPTDYRARLKLPPDSIDNGREDLLLFTRNKLLVATGFKRVVIGGRGPYVEFEQDHLVKEAFRWEQAHSYYTEYRTVDACNVKAYHQLATVDYADYRVGLWYLSPFELTNEDGETLIDPLPRRGTRQA